jgi:hypothetical protein
MVSALIRPGFSPSHSHSATMLIKQKFHYKFEPSTRRRTVIQYLGAYNKFQPLYVQNTTSYTKRINYVPFKVNGGFNITSNSIDVVYVSHTNPNLLRGTNSETKMALVIEFVVACSGCLESSSAMQVRASTATNERNYA